MICNKRLHFGIEVMAPQFFHTLTVTFSPKHSQIFYYTDEDIKHRLVKFEVIKPLRESR